MIFHQLWLGLAAIATSVAVHATFMAVGLGHVRQRRPRFETALGKCWFVVAVVMWFFLSICIQCWGWAVLLRWLGALGDLEEALYFATVSFTTVGYGDIVLGKDWRLLGAFAGANGAIILGWTTALVLFAVQRAYRIDAAD